MAQANRSAPLLDILKRIAAHITDEKFESSDELVLIKALDKFDPDELDYLEKQMERYVSELLTIQKTLSASVDAKKAPSKSNKISVDPRRRVEVLKELLGNATTAFREKIVQLFSNKNPKVEKITAELLKVNRNEWEAIKKEIVMMCAQKHATTLKFLSEEMDRLGSELKFTGFDKDGAILCNIRNWLAEQSDKNKEVENRNLQQGCEQQSLQARAEENKESGPNKVGVSIEDRVATSERFVAAKKLDCIQFLSLVAPPRLGLKDADTLDDLDSENLKAHFVDVKRWLEWMSTLILPEASKVLNAARDKLTPHTHNNSRLFNKPVSPRAGGAGPGPGAGVPTPSNRGGGKPGGGLG